MTFSAILCTDRNGGIGLDGKIPWHHKKDLQKFKSITMGSTLIMGRKTYESLGGKELPGRKMVIVSKKMNGPNVYTNLDAALEACKNETVFVAGGKELYHEAFEHPLCTCVYLTRLSKVYKTDTQVDLTILQNGWIHIGHEIFSDGFFLKLIPKKLADQKGTHET